MKYPETFIAKCKRVFPNWTQLHKCLDKGSPSVGRMINECAEQTTFHYNEILRATSLEELQQKAECDRIIQNYRKEEQPRYQEQERARFNRERLGYM